MHTPDKHAAVFFCSPWQLNLTSFAHDPWLSYIRAQKD